MLVCLLLACCEDASAVSVVASDVVVEDGTPLLVLGLSLNKAPPGDPSRFSVEVNSEAQQPVHRTLRWAELAELDSDPTTTADRWPVVGQAPTFRIPLPLKTNFVKGNSRDVTLSIGVNWGTLPDGAVKHQVSDELSLEPLYERRNELVPIPNDPENWGEKDESGARPAF